MASAPTGQRGEELVSLRELAGAARHVGSGFRARGTSAAQQAPEAAALRGEYRMVRLREGLVLHSSDAVDLVDMTTSVERPPGLTLHVMLHGRAEARLDGKDMGLACGEDGVVEAVLISRAEPALFERTAHAGARMRKVNITISPDWLEDSALDTGGDFRAVERFARTHLARFAWRLDRGALSLVEQMLHPPSYLAPMRNLYLESRSLELIAEGFARISSDAAPGCGGRLSPHDLQRLRRVEDYVEAHDAPGEIGSLDQIARACGVSVSTLGRLVRAAHGATVFEYIRSRGMDRARRALEHEGATVAEAAYLAGYSSAANFATAFKRRFGVTPSETRRR